MAQDRVAAVGRPEVRCPRLLAEHAVGVIGSVRALPFEQAIEGERKLDDTAVLAVRPSRRGAHRDERQRRQRDEDHGRARQQHRAHARTRTRHCDHEVDGSQADRERSEQHRRRIAVEHARRSRKEGSEPAGKLRQPRLVEQPPREDSRRVVEQEIARDEQKRARDDGRV